MSSDQEDHPLQQPLHEEELSLVTNVVEALQQAGGAHAEASVVAIRRQVESLAMFGELLYRYPSPLQEQSLGGVRRGLQTLVDTIVDTDQATFPFRAPTQAMVGRAMNMAQINFLRMLWHLTGALPPELGAAKLREQAARRLRASVHCRLVEEVLADIVTDRGVPREQRAEGVRSLAQLWGNRLTFRVDEFFPILAETWEARQRVRVIGGTLAGSCEMMQLMTQGADEAFVDLFAYREYGEVELEAFREFLFGKSSEELERLAMRMAREGLTSIQLDERVAVGGRDAGSILFEFFRSRLVQCSARRVAGLPGPRHTAEGYVMLAWLAKRVQSGT
ncbi:MAG: hypothetical protein H6835_12100 [Planctomycetes bacterium]|nr:hypothetical protein [Planctomycetota bacterium]